MARTLAASASMERKSRHGFRARSGGGLLLPPLVVLLLMARVLVRSGPSIEVHKMEGISRLVPLKAQNFLASRRSLEGSYTCRHVKIGLRPS
jgi:hypothetical protein